MFGPDGMLWIGMGDSGSGGDPNDNAQSLGTLFGKMLRIDPRPSGGRPYTIPPDNPFVGRDGARPEIWAYGLRNPWRYSFDRSTGDLWIGDVGQNAWEEIDFVAAGSSGGENFGWARLEGSHRVQRAPHPRARWDPIHEYRNGGDGCCGDGRLRLPRRTDPRAHRRVPLRRLLQGQGHGTAPERRRRRWSSRTSASSCDTVDSFGEDADGELYVCSLGGEIARIDPAVDPAPRVRGSGVRGPARRGWRRSRRRPRRAPRSRRWRGRGP